MAALPRGEVELAVDRTHMGVNGDRAHNQLASDLAIRQAGCHQGEYLQLTGGQACGLALRLSKRRAPFVPGEGDEAARGWIKILAKMVSIQ